MIDPGAKPVSNKNEKDDDSKTETETAYRLITSGGIADSMACRCQVHESHVDCPNSTQEEIL